jgi:tetratricopeptide (TPR) repeat protein
MDFITTTRVGISEGKMHAGMFGGNGRQTYGVLGRAANVAAGLMERANSGQVLVTGPVAEAASGSYDFHRLPGEDLEIYQLGDRKSTAQVLAPKGRVQTEFVGRAHERGRLRASLDALLQGRSDVIVIEGPPGIGKSRLLVDFREQAEALAISSFVGAGNAIEAETPFHAWKTIFAGVLGITPNSDEAEVRAALDRHLANAPRLLELAPLLNPVLPVKLPDNDLTARMPPDVRSENALEVMVGCLGRPVGTLGVMLLILDDAQWLDSGSAALVEAAHRHHPSLLIALAMRPTEPDSAGERDSRSLSKFRSLLDMQDEVLHLEPLGANDLTELIRLYLGVNELPSSLTWVVLERAEGNPFFAQEVVDALIQRGLVRIRDGTCEVLGTPEQLSAEFPERIEKLIISRLDHLPSAHRTALMVASVLGRTFSLQMMENVHPSKIDLETLRGQMDGLVALGLVDLDHEEPDLVYRFRHGLTHQAASELVPGSLRGEILGKAARWIEATKGADLTPFWPVLARYWDAAGDVSKSLVYLDLAAANAAATGAYEEAITFYTRAINLTDQRDPANSGQVAKWHLRVGEIYVHRQSDDVTKGAENLEAGLHTLGLGAPRGSVGQVLAITWQLMLQVWYRLTASRRVARSEGADLLLEASRAYERLVEVYYISGKTLPSLYASLRSLNLAEAAGPSPELTRGWATFGALLGFVPLRRMAGRYLDRALAAVDSSDPSAEAWAALVAGFYYSGLGEWTKAEAQTERVVVLSQQIGDGRRLEDGLSNLMFQAYLRGDLVRGLELADELQGRAVARQADRPLAYCLQGRSYCLLNLGRTEEARQAIEELEDLQARDPRPTDQALIDDTLGLKALSELYRGNLRQALPIAEILVTRISKGTPSNFSTLAAYQAPAEVYIEAWRHNVSDRKLRRMVKKSLKSLKKYTRVFPIGRPSLLRWEGVYEELRGRHEPAIRTLESSLAEATKLGMRLAEARTLRELIGILDGAHPDVAEYQRRAEEIQLGGTATEAGGTVIG